MKRFTVGPTLLGFVRTVEHGSFAAAARTMDVSPAALGQSVGRLEKHFGVKLLNRTTRRMSLTPEGQMLIERARGPLQEIDEISRLFEESRGKVSGPLRVSAPVGVARHQLVPLIADFAKTYPAVEVEIDATDEMRDLAHSRIDVAFRILLPQDSTVIARPISDLKAPTLASPGYLASHGEPKHPRDLHQHKCIGYRYLNSGRIADFRFKTGSKDFALPFHPTLIVNDIDTACDAAAAGMGIVQPPSTYARRHIEAGRLVPILRRFEAKPWRIYLCFTSRREMPLRVRTFIDFALNHLRRGAREAASGRPSRRS